MKFEVKVDDALGMPALEAARLAQGVADMPSFVQSIIDKAVASAQARFMPQPMSFPEALKKIEDLKAQLAEATAPTTVSKTL